MKSELTTPLKKIPKQNGKQLVVLSASIKEHQLLVYFLNECQLHFSDVVYLIWVDLLAEGDQYMMLNHLSLGCDLPLLEATKHAQLKNNQVYLINSSEPFVLAANTLTYKNDFQSKGRTAIEDFWSSLAHHHFTAVGIHLGGNADHLKAMSELSDAGGLTIVHNDVVFEQAEYTDEILNCVDHWLPLTDITKVITDYWLKNQSEDLADAPGKPTHITAEQDAAKRHSVSVFSDTNWRRYFTQKVVSQYVPPTLFLTFDLRLVHVVGQAGDFLSLPQNQQPPAKGWPLQELEPTDLVAAIKDVVAPIIENKTTAKFYKEADIEFEGKIYWLDIWAELWEMTPVKEALIMIRLEEVDSLLREALMDEQDIEVEEDTPVDDIGETLTTVELPEMPHFQEEYNDNILELGELRDDLENLLQTSNRATLFLGPELSVRKASSSISNHIKWVSGSIEGRGFGELDFVENKSEFKEDCKWAMETKVPLDRDVLGLHGNLYLRRVHPYFSGDEINGVVVTYERIAEVRKVNERLDQLSKEFEDQGVTLISTISKLKREGEEKKKKSAELAREQTISRSILNSMPDGVIALDDTGKVIKINEVAKGYTGLGVDDDIQKWARKHKKEIILNDVLAAKAKQSNPFIAAAKGKVVADTVVRMKALGRPADEEGEALYLNISAVELTSGMNARLGMVMVLTDITRLVKIEIELRKSERAQKALLDAIPDLLCRVDEKGIYRAYYPPKSGEEVVPAAAFIGNSFKDVLPHDLAADMYDKLQLSLSTGQLVTFDFDYLHTDYTIKFYEARFAPLNEKEALCMIRDLTEQMIGQESVYKSAEYYKMLISKSNIPIVMVTQQGFMFEINQAMLGLIKAKNLLDIDDRSLFSFLDRRDRIVAKDILKRGFEDEVPEGVATFMITDLEGNKQKVEVTGTRLNFKGKLVIQLVLMPCK